MEFSERQLQEILDRVSVIAVGVGKFISEECEHFDHDRVEQKHTHDYVSYVDKASEKRIVTALQNILPNAGFLTEEGTVEYQSEGVFWIVDPLDGTTNFIHNTAPYCVSIALATNERVLLGVVYECCRKELFTATCYSEAKLNGKTIHVSGKDSLSESLILLGLPYDSDMYSPKAVDLLRSLYGNDAGTRILGAAAAELCYIAAGRAEGRVEAYLKPWDIAAGGLILKQAGGLMTCFNGRDNIYASHDVLASNGMIHDILIELAGKER